MKIASNKVEDMIRFYKETLSELYEASELDEIIFIVFNHYSNFTRQEMSVRLKDNLNQSELISIYDACKALQQNIPVQYVLNEAWFYNRPFYVNEDVLIPRPETEELTELALRTCKHLEQAAVLDIGTGSGCIPVTIACERSDWKVYACDVSEKALTVAKKNASTLQAKVQYFECDVLKEHPLRDYTEYDIMLSNPPYIKHEEAESMHTRVKDKEPYLALFVEDEDAGIFYKRIIDLCASHLKAKGYLFFELNPLTANIVKNYAIEKNYFSHIELINDMSGNCRFLKAIKL
jgi:release factor glutamine methyltransferase